MREDGMGPDAGAPWVPLHSTAHISTERNAVHFVHRPHYVDGEHACPAWIFLHDSCGYMLQVRTRLPT